VELRGFSVLAELGMVQGLKRDHLGWVRGILRSSLDNKLQFMRPDGFIFIPNAVSNVHDNNFTHPMTFPS
jgi:hypothetical protein